MVAFEVESTNGNELTGLKRDSLTMRGKVQRVQALRWLFLIKWRQKLVERKPSHSVHIMECVGMTT